MELRMRRISRQRSFTDRTSSKLRGILTGQKRTVHFLHIGKTAGNQIKLIIKQVNAQKCGTRIKRHGHRASLRDIPDDEEFFFNIRNPISRFRSGFYGRKRKDQPRKLIEWTPYEAMAFSEFEHANDLAEALFSGGELGVRAFGAMKSISHVSMNQVDWFSRMGNLLDLRPPLCIIRQEKFDQDVRKLAEGVGFEGELYIERHPTKSHVNDYSQTPDLSKKALANLERWYAQDFEFYKACEAWIERNDQ